MADGNGGASSVRGPEAVRASLIKAARELLAEVGPNGMSVRTVAAKAGVNHGLVHHYFGGKQGLVEASARQLALEHLQHAHERADGALVPPPLTLGEDAQYLRTMVRLVLDGHLETAVREIVEGYSIPGEIQQRIASRFPDGQAPPEVKARLAVTFAMEMGWAALEPLVLKMADVGESEMEDVRTSARALARRFIHEIEEGPTASPSPECAVPGR